MCKHLDVEGRKSLVYGRIYAYEYFESVLKYLYTALTFEKFRFNWLNPTGHWRLNLADRLQRSVMMRLSAINHDESEYSRLQSRRGDTSQWVSKFSLLIFLCSDWKVREIGTTFEMQNMTRLWSIF